MDLKPGTKIATPFQQLELDQLTEDWELSRVLHLPADATIVVAGAYQGKLMQWFLERYPLCQVIGYEPAMWALEAATQRLKPYSSTHAWELKPWGLGIQNLNDAPMFDWETDGCTFMHRDDDRPQGTGSTKEANDQLLLDAHGGTIDLLVLNMEGFEWYLVPHIMGLMGGIVQSVAIQFHLQYMPSKSIYGSILQELDDRYLYHFNYFLPAWGLWTNVSARES